MDAILMLQDQVRSEPLRVASEADQVPDEFKVGAPVPAHESQADAGW